MKNPVILCMDDDADDIQLLQDAFLSINPDYRIVQASNGEKGLAMLMEIKHDSELPCLVILDINMPRLDGKETFMKMKADPKLSGIPVVIFSTSDSPADKVYFKHRNTEYITKPVYFSHFIEVAKKLVPYCVM